MQSPSAQPVAPVLLSGVSDRVLSELREYLGRHRATVEEMIRKGGPDAGLPAGVQHARAMDGLLCALFHAVRGVLTKQDLWRHVTLAAVGSYGRGAVALHSDLDVRLLCMQSGEEEARIAEALLYPLWDTGLSVGHQVVTPDQAIELARSDIPTATTLLDWRRVAGNPGRADEALERVYEGIFGTANLRAFLTAIEEQSAARYDRFGGSVYLLEPEVKNGAGGLRDLDVAGWAARARWRTRDLGELVRLGILVPREWAPLEEARAFLWRIRNMLHLRAKRRSDRFGFELQELAAEQLGYGSGGPGVEAMMSDYYRHAREVVRGKEMILARAMPPPKRRPKERGIPGGLRLIGGEVGFGRDASIGETPLLALRLYVEAVRRDLPVHDAARDQVARATSLEDFCKRLRDDPASGRLLRELVCTAAKTKVRRRSLLRELHDVGILVAMVPEFAPVVGRVHHDIYHVYTVDAHSVAAVDKLRALCRGDVDDADRVAARLAAEMARPTVVFFATLLHDVGKDLGGRNHSERGAELARTILQRLGLKASDIEQVAHLILNHLRMYHVATRRDLDDEKTLSDFAAVVGSRLGLRELYLLTVCDVSTTSPTAMTSWKARMLEELYVATDRYLDQGGALVDDTAQLREDVLSRAIIAKLPAIEMRHLCQAVPTRYFVANDVDWMVNHLAHALEDADSVASIRVLGTDSPYVELSVVGDDRPGMLAAIAATFAASRVKIIGAQVYNYVSPDGRRRVLDAFWVRLGTDAKQAVRAVPKLQRGLVKILAGNVAPRDLAREHLSQPSWTEKRSPSVPVRVNVDNRAASAHTIIEVVTQDRFGLLQIIADELARAALTVELAKINTEGSRVFDVFYVQEADGSKVTNPSRIEAIKEGVIEALSVFDEEGGA